MSSHEEARRATPSPSPVGVDAMREALEPFAKIADQYDAKDASTDRAFRDELGRGAPPSGNFTDVRVSLGQCRAARAALASAPQSVPAGTRDDGIEAAAKALEPFANEARKYEPVEDDDEFHAFDSNFTIGDLRRARDAYRNLKSQPAPAGRDEETTKALWALEELAKANWRSVEKDNMEFEVRTTCFVRDAILAFASKSPPLPTRREASATSTRTPHKVPS